MGYLGEDVKKLGFGLMRLPKIGEEIDIEQTKEMVDMFLEAGFTYFDTAFLYNGSEEAIRKALVERYPRDKYTLATKMAAWMRCETREDAIKQFETSLERTGAGYFDFYLMHNLGTPRTQFFDEWGLWDWALEKKAEGLIKHLGFSFHSSPAELEEILIAHPEAEFVQLQINYADWESPAIQSRACYEMARKYDKPVVIMEPVKGGMLANPPKGVADVFKAAEPDSSVASWAVRFAADLEGLITVLSGMSSVEQMADNLSYMKDFTGMTPAQKETMAKAREELDKIPMIPCTRCDYCAKVCPMEIGIPLAFNAMNVLSLSGDLERAKGELNWLINERGKKMPSECIQCGACESACPQHIEIRDHLVEIAEALE